jgi:uncharacterized protein YukE
MSGNLIRMVHPIVEQVLQQLVQQFTVVQEQALAPVREIVAEVTGGVWKGDGAVAFVNELNSLAIPGIGRVGEAITTANKNLQFARETIDAADQQMQSLVQSRLFDAMKFY